MTEAREAELMAQIPTLATLAEAHGFREALRDAGDALTGAVHAALLARIDLLQKREVRA
jgi:hypothetical protein